jgi:hypothetical protein
MSSNRERKEPTLVDVKISYTETDSDDSKAQFVKGLELKNLKDYLFTGFSTELYKHIIFVEVIQGELVLHDKAELFQNSKIRSILGKVKLSGDCSRMFYNAINFDHSLTEWDLEDLTSAEDIFTGTLNDPNVRTLFRERLSKTQNTVDTSNPDQWLYPQFTEGSTGIKFTEDLTYNLISGPVSLKYYESNDNRTAFLIFGDVHESRKNMCDVECNRENSCTNLHDDDFLEALNALAGDDRKARRINFCVEASKTAIVNFLETRNDERMSRFDDQEDEKTDGNLKECVFKVIRSEGIYQNITIIGLDNRHDGNENNIMQHFTKLYRIFVNYLNGASSGFFEPVKMHRNEWNDGFISEWLHNGFESDGFATVHPMIKLVEDFLDLLENESVRTRNTDYITQELRNQKKIDRRRNNNFWANSIPYDFYEKNDFMIHLRENNDQQDLQNIIDCCIRGVEVEPGYKKTVEHLAVFFLYFGALIHDIRLVAYLLNQEARDQVLTLNILYYGDLHTLNINSMLEHIPAPDSTSERVPSRKYYTNYVSVNKYKDDSLVNIQIVDRCIDLEKLNVFIDLKGFFDQDETVPKLMARPNLS